MTLFEKEIITVPLTHETFGHDQRSQSPLKEDAHQGTLKFPGIIRLYREGPGRYSYNFIDLKFCKITIEIASKT